MTHDEFIAHLVIKDKKQARTWLWYARSSTWAFLFFSILNAFIIVFRPSVVGIMLGAILFMVMTIVFLYTVITICYLTQRPLWEVIVSCFFLPLSLFFLYPRLVRPLKVVLGTREPYDLPQANEDMKSLALQTWIERPWKRLLIATGIVALIITYGMTTSWTSTPYSPKSQERFSYPDDGFSIALPKEPTVTVQTSPTGEKLNQYYVKGAGGISYAIWVQTVTTEQVKTEAEKRARIKEAMMAYEGRTDGVRLKESTEMYFQSFPATRFTLTDEKSPYAYGIAFVAYNHFYHLIISLSDDQSSAPLIAIEFFDSFIARAP